MPMLPRSWLAVVALAVGLAGCGDSAGLTTAVGEQTATYRVLDLERGSSTYRTSMPDLADNPAYRDQLLVLHYIPAHTTTIGAESRDLFADADERTTRGVPIRELYIGVFELTRNQWRRVVAGHSSIPSEPWSEVGVDNGAPDHPATGMSQAVGERALHDWGTAHGLLMTLANDEEWEDAARAGGGIYPFDPANLSEVGRFARVRETLSIAITTDSGTAPVGRRSANAWGLYDMTGNAAELTSTLDADEQAHVRGGSWNDPVAATRSSNVTTVPPFAGHPLVGLRVVLRP